MVTSPCKRDPSGTYYHPDRNSMFARTLWRLYGFRVVVPFEESRSVDVAALIETPPEPLTWHQKARILVGWIYATAADAVLRAVLFASRRVN
jgi:hypothetical protein